jgi:hypothetical protein
MQQQREASASQARSLSNSCVCEAHIMVSAKQLASMLFSACQKLHLRVTDQ